MNHTSLSVFENVHEKDVHFNQKKRKSISVNIFLILMVATLSIGFGAGYWARSGVRENSNSNANVSTVKSAPLVNELNEESVCASNPSIESITLSGDTKNISGAFKTVDVSNHFDYSLGTSEIAYGSNLKSTFSCVDARKDDPIMGTPGGDLAEFAMGMQVYFNSTGTPPQLDIVRQKFQSFLINQITEQRPFYYHTDDTRLRLVFMNLTLAFGRNVTILPHSTPINEFEKEAWLSELTQSYAQGCGHIRLMMNSPTTYGLPDDFVIKSVIRVFYEEWWLRSQEQKKIFDFSIKLGSLSGRAIAVVTNSGPSCTDASPKILPNIAGSSLFVYHPDAVAAFRERVLTPFFLSESNGKLVNSSSFFNLLSELFSTQLSATLTQLVPANAVDLFSVKVKSV